MRFLVNCDFTSQRLTGVQRYALEMLKGISRMEEIEISCYSNRPVLIEYNEVTDLVKVIKCNPIVFRQLVIPILSIGRKLITFTGSPTFLKTNQILTIHDLAPIVAPDSYSVIYRMYFTLGLKFATKHLSELSVVSDFTRRALYKFAPSTKANVRIHPNGHEHLIRKSDFLENINEGEFLLVIGNNHFNKNLKIILDTYNFHQESDNLPKIIIVGRFEKSAVFKEQRLEYSDRIKVINNPSDSTLVAYLTSSNALIIPSLYEGFGIPLLEAVLYRKKVVCSDLEVFHEIAEEYPCYFDPRSIDSLVAALKTYQGTSINEDLRTKILKKFSWKKSALDFYNDFLKS